MKFLKKTWFLLTLMLCLTALLPLRAQAGTLLESGTFTSYPNLTWEVVGGDSINPQTLTISGSGYIPGWHDSTLYNGYPWDSYKTGIERVVVEGSVTSVGAGAFRDIPNLKKVELGPTVTRIGSYAFQELTKLETVIIEGTIQEMSSYAFDGCTALQNLTMPYATGQIYDYAFRNCTSLKSITIPEGVKYLSQFTFYGCSSLITVTIPSTLESVGQYAFDGCTNLSGVYITDLAAWCGIDFDSSNSNPLLNANGLYLNGSRIRDLVIPDGVTEITDYAFENITNLYSVTIPDSVTHIGNCSFADCKELETITFLGGPQVNSWKTQFKNVTATAYYPHTNANWTDTAKANLGGNLTWVALACKNGHTTVTDPAEPGTCLTAGKTQGSHCSTCNEVFTAQSSTGLGNHSVSNGICTVCNAYGTCGNSASWTFDEETGKLTISGTGAVTSNPWRVHWLDLTSVTVGSGITSLCDGAFAESTMSTVTLPASLTKLGEQTFRSCTTLTDVNIPSGVTEIPYSLFGGCYNLPAISLPEGITAIGDNAFADCQALTEVILPESLTSIGDMAFGNCTGLTEITLPAKVTSVGSDAFNGSYITAITFDGAAPTFNSNALRGITATASYPSTGTGWSSAITQKYGGDITWKAYTPTEGTFGEAFSWHFEESTGVLTLSGQGSMTGFTGADAVPWGVHREKVTSLVVEEGISALASYSAAGMTNLTSISLPLTLDSIGNYVFQGCTDLPSVELPKNLTILGVNCFENCTSLTSVCLPDSVTVMAPYAFAGCTNLYAFQVGSGLTTLSNNVFQDCTSLQFFTIPETLTQLSPSAFEGSALITLTIPATVDSVALRCFADCEDLAVVNILGNTAIAYDAFAGVTATVYYPGESTYWSEYHRNLYPDTLTWVPYRENGCGPNLTWSFDEATGTLSITGTGPMDPFGLNDETGVPATPWVAHTEDITAVTLSNGVTTVGDFAFFGCTNLVSATLPDSLTYLGDGAFYAVGLTQLTVPKNVTEIGEGCFCLSTLTSVALPQGLTTLETAAFSNVPLQSVTIPGSLKVIPEYCFTACADLTEVILENGVTAVSLGAFDTTGLTSVSIPASVTAIEDFAFSYCDDLTHILFRGDAPQISQSAFQNVNADVYYYNTADWTAGDRQNYGGNLNWHSTYAMSGVCGDDLTWEFDPDTLTLTITGTGDMYPFYSMAPCSVEDVTTPIASPWANFSSAITTISLPEGLTGIGDCAFSFMENVRELTVPTTVTTVGYYAFEGMSSLEKLTFTGNAPAFAEYLGASTTIYFPADNNTWTLDLLQNYGLNPEWAGMANGIRIIGSNGDDYWSMNTATGTLTLGSLENTTGNCPDYTDGTQPWNHLKSSITKVVVEPSAEDIGDYYFAGFTALRTVEGMNRNMNIGAHAFDGCTGLSSNLTLGYIIGEYAFRNCTGLTEVSFSEYLWEIGSNAFSGCTGLTKLTFAGSGPSIADDAFTGVTADAWYDPNLSGWTQDKLADYGGDLTWKMSANEKCGDDLTWSFDETTGTLSISGTGEMYGYGVSFDSSETGLTTAPWNIYAADIRSITVAQGVTTVGGHAFEGTSVQQVSLPEGLLSIGSLAFGSCESLARINIPDSVTELGEACLCGTAITSFRFPASLTRLGEGIFAGCLYLESVTLPDSITAVPSQLFFICESLESVTIHSGITAIGEEAFGCSGLKSVTIPATVKTVAAEAFRDCASLTSITLTDGTDIAYDAFDGVTATVYYPAGSTFWTEELQNKYADTLTWTPLYPTSGKCGDNLTWSFDEETGKLTISGTGEMYDRWFPYGDAEFAPWCNFAKSITSVEIGSGVTTLGHFAFYGCTNLKSVPIPEGVTMVGCAFVGSGVTEISIPASVTDFRYPSNEGVCTTLKKITVDPDNTVYSSDENGMLYNKAKTAFLGCPTGYSGSVSIASTATEIGGWAFVSCSGVSAVSIPDGVTSIGMNAFAGCSSLSSLDLPASLKTISDLAFFDCDLLESVEIPASCTSLGSSIFGDCDSLETVSFSGPAPTMIYDTFHPNTITAYYPAGAEGWDEAILEDYGGNITWIPEGMKELKITSQPKSVTVAEGEKATVSFTAEGDGLTYTWYFKDAGASKFSKTDSFTSNKYYVTMTDARDGRQVYCVVTDQYNKTVRSDTVTISMEKTPEPVKITVQPKSVTVAEGEKATVSFTAEGDGLTYTWYFKDAGASKFSKTDSFTSNKYYVTMTDARDGRQVYCVVTDKNNNTARTDTVTISMKKPDVVTIVTQPKNVTVAEGEKATVSFTAAGEGLTYKWYFKDAGSSKFSLTTSFTSNKYSVTMTEARDGRQVYCVVTDKNNNTAQTNTVTLSMEKAAEPVKITVQPKSVTVAEGEKATVSFTATGEGLTYKWYFKDAGSSKFSLTTSFTSNKYSVTMTEARDGRQVYCVVSDIYGNTATSATVTLSMETEAAPVPVDIVTQPKSISVADGTTAKVTVQATGDGLTYQWYLKNPGSTKFSKSSVTTASYSCKMTSAIDGRQVYCIVSDQYGNTATSATVTLSMQKPAVTITAQPTSVSVADGATAKVSVTATGDGLTYQWYLKNPGKTSFSKSSVTSSTYSCKMSSTTDGRQVYCIITDAYGNSVKTNTVTLSMK